MSPTLELFTAQSGRLSAKLVADEGATRHLHSLVKPEVESHYFTDLTLWGNVIVFAGTGLGYHLAEAIKSVPRSALLVVMDYYETLIDHCLKTVFADLPNTVISLSSSDYRQMESELLKLVGTVEHPCLQIVKHPVSFDIRKEFYKSRIATIQAALLPRIAKRDVRKKALLLSGNFFLQQEVRRALSEACEEDPELFLYESCTSGIDYESRLQRVIQEARPDFVVSINMKGFDGNGFLGETTSRMGIPVVVWFVDDPRPILLSQRQHVGRQMIALCWEKAYLPFLETCGFGATGYLPLATDPALFSQAEPPKARTRLGFVGSPMGRTFLGEIQGKFLWSAALAPLVEKASDVLLASPARDVSSIIEDVAHETSFSLPFTDSRNRTWLGSYVIHSASMKKRKRVMESLCPLGIETFGDPEGWRELLGRTVRTHHNIDYATELCSAYQSIGVNINITSCQMSSAVNQRVFDIPMSGSFVISDNQKDLGELFDLGKEAVCYRDQNDVREIVQHYLDHPEARSAITKAAQTRIRNEHTYVHRVRAIIKLV